MGLPISWEYKLAKEICVPLVFIHHKLTFCAHVWAEGTSQVAQ